MSYFSDLFFYTYTGLTYRRSTLNSLGENATSKEVEECLTGQHEESSFETHINLAPNQSLSLFFACYFKEKEV